MAYFRHRNDKNIPELENPLVLSKRGGTPNFETLQYVALVSVKATEVSEEDQRAFVVVFNIGGSAGGSPDRGVTHGIIN
jgi:hypothetical protein